uniref:inositol-polyphosphate 5-phosphatase n=1 Tax=Neobodo designis TaxID=312471 RepID=A0A7S1M6F7_NEODS
MSETRPEPLQWLLLSQNIGTIECTGDEVSEENKTLTTKWIDSVRQHILDEEQRAGAPIDIVVLHLQEVGGKKFNKAFNQHLEKVVHLCTPYKNGWCSGPIMPDSDDGVTFTAMATVFFVGPRVWEGCSVLSFRHRVFIALSDNPVQWVGSRRALFHGSKFSAAGSSRKGYLITALRVGNQTFNFVNVHLFHDADNSVAAKESPSEYAVKRVEALNEIAAELAVVAAPEDPLFIFGDFNFRLDIGRVVKALEQQFDQKITLGKKKVSAPDAAWKYLQDPTNWEELRTYDTEGPAAMRSLRERSALSMAEPHRGFGPTYLRETDAELVEKNATTTGDHRAVFKRDRFPAWCDRVWINTSASQHAQSLSYWTAGLHEMDHQPVQLRFTTVVP